MKTQFIVWLLLFCFAALPVAATDDEPKHVLLGRWHVQFIKVQGQEMIFSPEFSMQMTFGKDGRVHMLMKIDGEVDNEEWSKYELDKENGTITSYRIDDDGNAVESGETMNYRIDDELLVFSLTNGDQKMTMELTRDAEGTGRHKALREKDDGQALKAIRRARETARSMMSSTQMRGLHQGAVTYSNSNRRAYPPSIGDLVVGDYCTPEYVLTPWSKVEVPEDFDDWAEQEKIDWANENTGYVYLLAGKKEALSREVIAIFELPRSAEQEEVRLGFEDNSVRPMPYKDADKLIKEQTGYTIKQWMKTTSPGTGTLVVPDEGEDGQG